MGDFVARYLKLKGYDVLHPIGWDSFGLNAENAAIDRNAHPAEWTYANIETQATSFRRYGMSFDWSAGCTPPIRITTAGPSGYSCDSGSRPGIPQGELCQLVPEGPDGPGERSR